MPRVTDIRKLRKNYQTVVLEKRKAKKNPFDQFHAWFEEALAADFVEPNAMNLATVSRAGDISSRMVLLKAYDKSGFVFFTNYNSDKAQDLQSTRIAALCFWWDMLYRQVRITGHVEKIPAADSAEYFQTRPRGSQLGALASQQSKVIKDYSVLERAYRRLETRYRGQEVIPSPTHWGGFRVIPSQFEFWQGRPNRLHDRLRYSLAPSGDWKVERLSP